MKRKIWRVKEISSQAKEWASKCGLLPILTQVLINRNIKESEIDSFLNHSLSNLHCPFLLPDMEKACQRIKQAVRGGEKILVVGDYDVDGITSLAIFHEFIKEYPGLFSFYIPHRVNEGYGLSEDVVNKAKNEGRTLIVAFDCGTNSSHEIELASSFGIDTVVIDHHHPQDNFGAPYAFVNPKRGDSKYPFYDLSAGALSFKLLQALSGDSCFQALDLVALSLVCDVVPLKGENRILLREGLKYIKNTPRLAIKALCKVSSLKQQNIDSFHIGFVLGPRINAAGRVAHAQDSLDIFLGEDEEKVYSSASKLGEYNRLRKDIESKILKEAEQIVEKDFLDSHAIVVSNDGWHPGVLGIVASRLVNKYYRPSFVISFDDNVGRGSGRSIHSVHLMEALNKCSDHLHLYGGHRKAAGIHIFKEELATFKDKINSFIKENLTQKDLIPVLDVDLKIDFSEISLAFIEELDKLKPFGEDNPKPLFTSYGVTKKSVPRKIPMGYSVWFQEQGRIFEGIVYSRDLLQILEYGNSFDIVYSLEKNTYHNIPKLTIKDCRLSESEG
jgi:single-stranded-DNA-specific exonuclease